MVWPCLCVHVCVHLRANDDIVVMLDLPLCNLWVRRQCAHARACMGFRHAVGLCVLHVPEYSRAFALVSKLCELAAAAAHSQAHSSLLRCVQC